MRPHHLPSILTSRQIKGNTFSLRKSNRLKHDVAVGKFVYVLCFLSFLKTLCPAMTIQNEKSGLKSITNFDLQTRNFVEKLLFSPFDHKVDNIFIHIVDLVGVIDAIESTYKHLIAYII